MKSIIVGVVYCVVIAVAISVVDILFLEGYSSGDTFEMIKGFSVNLLWSLGIGGTNMYLFDYFKKINMWRRFPKTGLFIGISVSIVLTGACIFLLNMVTYVLIYDSSFDYFINNQKAITYWISITITVVITISVYIIHHYKRLSEKKVKESQIVAKTESARYESLKSQLDPHFLFNSLNVLVALIHENPSLAEQFTTKLSKVYRYVLQHKNKDLVLLDEELNFAKTYMDLLRIRFEDGLSYEIEDMDKTDVLKVVPLSLQILLENCIKHNHISKNKPLHIVIGEENGVLFVRNNQNPKETIGISTKIGLQNIADRYGLITKLPVIIINNKEEFTVKLPLLTQKINQMRIEETSDSEKYLRATKKVKEIKDFYNNLMMYCIMIPWLIFINLRFSPRHYWFFYPMIGWGIGLVFHGIGAFGFNPLLGKDWENKKIREFMDNDNKPF